MHWLFWHDLPRAQFTRYGFCAMVAAAVLVCASYRRIRLGKALRRSTVEQVPSDARRRMYLLLGNAALIGGIIAAACVLATVGAR
jgi:hypothetical protein